MKDRSLSLKASAFFLSLLALLYQQLFPSGAFAAKLEDLKGLQYVAADSEPNGTATPVKPAATPSLAQPAPLTTGGATREAAAATTPNPGAGDATALPATTAAVGADDTAQSEGDVSVPKMMIKPGQPISFSTETEDITPTDDVDRARAQSIAYPTSPEAAFIYAVALTRTSRVEDALKEVRRAKHLAQAQGGAAYFNKMISTYEGMLEYYPDDNHVRYSLAWAYYMKAYLLCKAAPAAVPNPTPTAKGKKVDADLATHVIQALSPQMAGSVPASQNGKTTTNELPHIKGALELASPAVVPQVKKYYEAALKNLDDLLARNPKDMWAKVYRAHLNAEYTGDLKGSMQVWKQCQAEAPQNPAPYFFLGEGYLREGNLKECLNNISRAIALRAIGQ